MSRDTTASLPATHGRRDFLAAASVALSGGLAGCTGVFATEGNQVNIAGSSTVFPVTEAIASAFSEEYPTVNLSLSKTGTGGGFGNFFCAGRTDINNASRAIADAEIEQCGSNDVTPIEFQIATDALTVVVNPNADWVDCLTVEQLQQIWSADGANRWSDIDDEWPDQEFELYGAATTSGTFDYFNEAILGEELNHRNDYYATERDRTIVQGVRGSEAAMGYFGFSYYSENPNRIKAVSIDNGNGCVEPSIETAKSGEYKPLSRPLFIYVAKESLAESAVRNFVRFYMKRAATDLVSEVGYVPITEEQRDENLEKLDAQIAEVTG
ncbi:PstS family phosphate ABC transporter substrate-binding protein [Natrinema gelatinilyticum]|uniref:PstS family phosphate ABC transporter substrate-binding protein n=1 Tax=Natrinema gelatinilyticum TaxID=2961571 RepID=UPI0020C5AAAE|nr:PstS family phosphate ABC transporter substrate-binding protein [Natrinema gelatinilyticum]